MAKVDGPLMSLDASGTIGGAITFSKWKGVNYVRQRVSPYNPKSAGQTTQRTSFADGVSLWQVKDASTKTDWTDRAKALGYNMSGFNLFVQQYLSQGGDPTLP